MLIGIPPLLGPELLAVLRGMGHGDEIALVDGNYPAIAHGKRVVRADGHGVVAVADAILQVLPVDDFVPQALFRAAVMGNPANPPDPVHREMEAVCAHRARGFALTALPGPEFYQRVRDAFAIVATGEAALYGNMIIRKGVIRP